MLDRGRAARDGGFRLISPFANAVCLCTALELIKYQDLSLFIDLLLSLCSLFRPSVIIITYCVAVHFSLQSFFLSRKSDSDYIHFYFLLTFKTKR